ncbi:MAG: pyridoxal-dependent decarboxylase, exosortase A system-associated, partial [Erythrobacter sp.]
MKAKPTGPIPAGWKSLGGELAIAGRTASDILAEAGETPLFIYSRELIDRRIAQLRAALPGRIGINYAVKANPFAPVIEHMTPHVDGFDIASQGELRMVMQAGIDPDRVSFAGPGKRDRELAAAIETGVTLNCESEGEAERTLAIANGLGHRPRIAIRVNPDFELRGSG